MNFKMISYILGWILIFESLFMIVPSVTAVCYGESALWYFLITAAVCLAIGGLLIRKSRNASSFTHARETLSLL